MITERDGRESRIARKLWELGKGDVFVGITHGHEAKERIRAAIIDSKMQDLPVFVTAGGDQITFSAAFAATYGEPLTREQAA